MAEILSGMDALNALNDNGGSNENNVDFANFSSGAKYYVKVIGREVEVGGKSQVIGDFVSYFNYGIYKKVNSFTAKNPSKKSAKGYPVENLTPWDKAWKYHADLSKEFQDKDSQEAYKYQPKQKFVFGFIDLDTGKPILIDLTKKQAQAVSATITKYGKKLGKLAFELSKEGSSTNTVVALTPIIDMEDDLTDKQRKNFDDAPEQFDDNLFSGLLYEADDDEMVQLLVQAGFDVSKIGMSAKKADETKEDAKPVADEGADIDPDSLPF